MKLAVDVEKGEFTLKMDSYQDRKILELAAETYGRTKAEQDALSITYEIKDLIGKKGRLKMSLTSVTKAIQQGRLRAVPTGDKKGYRVSELACREFMKDVGREGGNSYRGEIYLAKAS